VAGCDTDWEPRHACRSRQLQLDEVGSFVWQLCDGEHSMNDLVETMMAKYKLGPFVFPGLHPEGPMSNMAMSAVLKRMNREDITVHGFRSTFRDWAGEQTDHPRELIEHALAHIPPSSPVGAPSSWIVHRRLRPCL